LRYIEFEMLGLMRAAEVIISAPLVEVHHEFAGPLSRGPRAARESGQGVTESEVDGFDKGSVDGAGEAERLEPSGQVIERAEAEAAFNASESAAV
jgi:hypothetical protein